MTQHGDSLARSYRIDEICEQFAKQWVAGELPKIEDLLAAHADVDPTILLRELLLTELELRRKRGELPNGDDYLTRFAEQTDAIESAFDKFAKRSTSPANVETVDVSINPTADTRVPDGGAFAETIVPAAETTPNESTESDSAGRRFGDYELLQEVARGGMGVVFKARQTALNRVVALKMIKSGELAGEDEVKRFRTEAEAAAQLDHPNIVPIYEVGEQQGQQFFSMGFVEGASLDDRLKDGPLPSKEAAELTRTIATAVQYAHDQGIIHRDLKPANILLDHAGAPRITDFGLAKNTTADSGMTATGQVMGTPSYMPPEQAAGNTDAIGPLADVYALGAVLYCLLTGRPPFQAAGVMETLKQVLEQEPVSPRTLNPAVDRDLETICLKCLQKDAANRYPSTQSLADDLQRFLTGRPIAARPISGFAKVWRWAKRHPARAGLIVTSVTSALVLVVGSLWFSNELRQERNNAQNKAVLAAAAEREANQTAKRESAAKAEAISEQKKAVAAKRVAVRESRRSNSLRLAAESLAARDISPRRSGLLAIHAIESMLAHHEIPPTAAVQCLRDALFEVGGQHLGDNVKAIAWLPGESGFLTVHSDGVKKWTAEYPGSEFRSTSLVATKIKHVFSDARKRFLGVVGSDRVARVWDCREGVARPRAEFQLRRSGNGVIDPQGQLLALDVGLDVIDLWVLAPKPRRVGTFRDREFELSVSGLRFSSDSNSLFVLGRRALAKAGKKGEVVKLRVVREPAASGAPAQLEVVANVTGDNPWVANGGSHVVLQGSEQAIVVALQNPAVRREIPGRITGGRGRYIVVQHGGRASVYDVTTAKPVYVVPNSAGAGAATQTALSSDLRHLALKAEDRVAFVDLPDGLTPQPPDCEPFAVKARNGDIDPFLIGPGGRVFDTVESGKVVHLRCWPRGKGTPVPIRLGVHERRLVELQVSPSSELAISVSADGEARLHRINDVGKTATNPNEPLTFASTYTTGFPFVAGKWLVLTDASKSARLLKSDRPVMLVDLASPRPYDKPVIVPDSVRARAIGLGSGRWLCLAKDGQPLRLLDLAAQSPATADVQLEFVCDGSPRIIINRSDDLLSVRGKDGVPHLFRLERGRWNHVSLGAAPGKTLTRQFDETGRMLLVSTRDKVIAWKVPRNGPARRVFETQGRFSAYYPPGISADGKWLAVSFTRYNPPPKMAGRPNFSRLRMGWGSRYRRRRAATRVERVDLWKIGDDNATKSDELKGRYRVKFAGKSGQIITLPYGARTLQLRQLSLGGQRTLWRHSAADRIGGTQVSPNGRWLLLTLASQQTSPVSSRKRVELLDLWNRRQIHLPLPEGLEQAGVFSLPASLSFDDSGRWLHAKRTGHITSGSSQMVGWRLPDLSNGSVKPVWFHHDQFLTEAVTRKDGKRLATVTKDGKVVLWNLTADRPEKSHITLPRLGSALRVFFGPADRWFIVKARGRFEFWHLNTQELVLAARRSIGRKLTQKERQRYSLPDD